MVEVVEHIGARAEPLPAFSFSATLERLVVQQEGRFFLWSPVILIAGIWSYFALPREPPAPVFVLAGGILLPLAWAMVAGRGGIVVKLVLVFLIGFSLAKLRTETVAAPVITAATGETRLTGTIEHIDKKSPRSAVMTLRVSRLEGLGVTTTPGRIRLTVNGSQSSALSPGLTISARARLWPLPSPVMPGGFDYGRMLWFAGIGATGRAFGNVEIANAAATWRDWPAAWLQDLREAMGARIEAVLPSERAAFAEALITGERASLPRHVIDSLQVSGLYHIISISGLHMSLVAGGIFWLVRALLALSPHLAVNYPIKKWAATAALIAGLFYMLLAGAEVATQRSYIMIAIMLIAILADRPALSLRNLVIAALIILMFFPEAALSASLQMSFLAVMGLLAFHEAWLESREREAAGPTGPLLRVVRSLWRSFLAMAFTTLIAGGLSSIAAVYHFGRLAPYSLLANLLALPVVSIIVMPMALAAALLMPLGLEAWPLYGMNEGLSITLSISDWVSNLPGANRTVPILPLLSAVLLGGAAAMLCLFNGFLRLIALPVFAAGILIAPSMSRPDILIERTGSNVAIRAVDGTLVPARPRRARFTVEAWLKADGDPAAPQEAARRSGWRCTADVCRSEIEGKRILYAFAPKTPPALDCDADILIAGFPLRGQCRRVPIRIDRFDVWRLGGHALYLGGSSVIVKTARAEQGRRPWVVAPTPRKKVPFGSGTIVR
jgi:competence protein ComEC